MNLKATRTLTVVLVLGIVCACTNSSDKSNESPPSYAAAAHRGVRTVVDENEGTKSEASAGGAESGRSGDGHLEPRPERDVDVAGAFLAIGGPVVEARGARG